MRSKFFLFIVCSALSVLTFASNFAQSPTPAAPVKQEPVSTVSDAEKVSTQTTLKSLRELKETNEQLLKKQQATLDALDELQKAADQLKIFSKRG